MFLYSVVYVYLRYKCREYYILWPTSGSTTTGDVVKMTGGRFVGKNDLISSHCRFGQTPRLRSRPRFLLNQVPPRVDPHFGAEQRGAPIACARSDYNAGSERIPLTGTPLAVPEFPYPPSAPDHSAPQARERPQLEEASMKSKAMLAM